jgi:hypothetical protein
VLLVVAVVVGALLLAVGRIVCRVEVQQNTLGGAVFAPLAHVELEESQGHPVAERASTEFSRRERVGWLARSSPLSGREPHASFRSGSARKESASF